MIATETERRTMKDPGNGYTIAYPRKIIARGAARAVMRVLLPVAFRIRITGRENFPEGGPLIVVGNHAAAMEAVLMAVYTPWQMEMLGAADIPHEKVTQVAIKVFGSIPVNRGHVDRPALNRALDVLKQGGVVAVFPEGGVWQTGVRRAQTGVAWLSYRAGAPVLPIGFGGTMGALGAALRFKRPELTMNVGKPMPSARLPQGKARKVYLAEYAGQVLDGVSALLPADDPARRVTISDERFELQVGVLGPDGDAADFPADLTIQHATALAKLLHQPAILKIFTQNLRLPTRPLEKLDSEHDAEVIADATRSILDYLQDENPYLLTYRFGPQEAEAMQAGLEELLAVAQWTSEAGFALAITPVRRFYSPDRGKEVVQIKQGHFEQWM
jgi:1-acyl-sn-glycerol-3-phosphate acyltransferase